MSSTLVELATERVAARRAIEQLRLAPVMFEQGARPHPPRDLYRAYLEQSDVFLGIYWEQYGWTAPGEVASGLEDEYLRAGDRARLLYVKEPAPKRDRRLGQLLERFETDDRASFKRFSDPDQLADLVAEDLASLLSERYAADDVSTRLRAEVPVPLTRLLGRSEELSALVDLVGGDARLVTVTGPGGVGKTRLALDGARVLAPSFPDGVVFVQLAQLHDAGLVVPAIAEALHARIEGAQSALDAVVDHLGNRRSLLVLDNAEHLLKAAARVRTLLERVPTLHILVTSREPLGVVGERELRIGPLAVPAPDAPLDVIDTSPAVRLFLERARAANPAFRVDEVTAPVVAELCRRLDGLPLAIELAAARTRLLPPSAMLQRLGDRLDVLAVDTAGAPTRHRTLRATIEWSLDLLSAREQSVFARLAIFSGGSTVEAAEFVAAPDGGGLDAISSLLNKSLVFVTTDDGAGEPRLAMLETVRSYGRERLRASDDEAATADRHLSWFARFAETAQPYLCGEGQADWATRVDAERANIREAVEWAFQRDDDARALELAYDLYVYYWIRDAVGEPEGWLERVAARGVALDDVSDAKLRSLRALTRDLRGEFGGSGAELEHALRVFEARSMGFEAAVTLKEIGFVRYVCEQDIDAAISALQKAEELFETVDHAWGVALVGSMLGSVLSVGGRRAEADVSLARALARARAIENAPLEAQTLHQIALARVIEGDPETALPFLLEAVDVVRRVGSRASAADCLYALAAVALSQGESRLAAVSLATADDTITRVGTPVWPTTQAVLRRLRRDVEVGVEPDVLGRNDVDVFEVMSRVAAELSSASGGAEPGPPLERTDG